MQKFEVQKRGRKTFEIVRVGEKIESRLERIGHELRALEDADFHSPESQAKSARRVDFAIA